MKYLLTLILTAALLCGCGRSTLPDEIPTEPSAPTAVSEGMYVPEGYQGSVQAYPLELYNVLGMRSFGDGLLLLSGLDSTTLTLLTGENLTIEASITLPFPLAQADPSLRFHNGPSLSYFDPEQHEMVILDQQLLEIRRISVPGALTGSPILSQDRSTLYYCTATDVWAWNLESGIRRRVKEMSFDTQTLTNLLIEDSVLQCLITEDGIHRSLFFSAETGQLLQEGKGSYLLTAEEERYFASIPAGFHQVLVFGNAGDSPQMLIPVNPDADAFFLPQENAVITAYAEGAQVTLDCYALDTGLRRCTASLGPFQSPLAVESCGDDQVYILTYDPDRDQNILYRWNTGEPASPDSRCYSEPWYSAEAADRLGLAQCQAYADQLSQRYGIEILIGEAAAETTPWDYSFAAEHLVPVIRQELTLLEQRLAQYPAEILTQTAAHFSSLKLCLVRSLSGSSGTGSLKQATGLQFLDGSDAYVVIAGGPYSEQALYHELFHVMETHIFSQSTAFDNWDDLNPAGFKYDYDYSANALRDSGVYLLSENRAFVDTYSMSFPKEDRARILEYAMLSGNQQLFCSKTMQAKLSRLCDGIREAYGLEDRAEPFLWEQYLE